MKRCEWCHYLRESRFPQLCSSGTSSREIKTRGVLELVHSGSQHSDNSAQDWNGTMALVWNDSLCVTMGRVWEAATFCSFPLSTSWSALCVLMNWGGELRANGFSRHQFLLLECLECKSTGKMFTMALIRRNLAPGLLLDFGLISWNLQQIFIAIWNFFYHCKTMLRA